MLSKVSEIRHIRTKEYACVTTPAMWCDVRHSLLQEENKTITTQAHKSSLKTSGLCKNTSTQE